MPRTKPSLSPKTIAIALLLLVVALAGVGYYNQTSHLDEEPAATPADQAILTPKPNDIIIGDINAIVTMVEYASLTCPHCAHFYNDIFPTLQKEFITTGKAKLIYRHFPLNEPAMKAAQLVECAGKNDLSRENVLQVLFSMQAQWAFGEDFKDKLEQIVKVAGLDSATVASCLGDKTTEEAIMKNLQEAAEKLQVSSTPTVFINGIKYEGPHTIDGFRDAIEHAGGGK